MSLFLDESTPPMPRDVVAVSETVTETATTSVTVTVSATNTNSPAPMPRHRTFAKRVMHYIRRGHLYFGLFLFPWVMLYGVTAFLFNHPSAFPDQPVYPFGPADTAGTPLEALPTPAEQAEAVVAQLNEKQKPATPYIAAAADADYATRDFIFGTVRSGTRTFSVIFYLGNGSGTIRETTPPAPGEKAPFNTGKVAAPRGMGMKSAGDHKHGDGVKLENSITDRFKATVPILLERFGLPPGDVSVTNAPDVKFPVEADGKTWIATYAPLSNSVVGVEPQFEGTGLSFRRFLLRMHLAHGYPGETNAKWFWAIIVDVMAAIMCFWGLSGLLMWWQIKATRRWGFATLAVSGLAATTMALAMHGYLAG